MSNKNSEKDNAGSDKQIQKRDEAESTERSGQVFVERKIGKKNAVIDTLPPPDHKPKKD